MGNVEQWVTLAVAIVGAIGSAFAVFKIRELHIIVNSRLTELLAVSKANAFKEGIIEEQQNPTPGLQSKPE